MFTRERCCVHESLSSVDPTETHGALCSNLVTHGDKELPTERANRQLVLRCRCGSHLTKGLSGRGTPLHLVSGEQGRGDLLRLFPCYLFDYSTVEEEHGIKVVNLDDNDVLAPRLMLLHFDFLPMGSGIEPHPMLPPYPDLHSSSLLRLKASRLRTT